MNPVKRRRHSVDAYTTLNRPFNEWPGTASRQGATSTADTRYQYAIDLRELNISQWPWDHIRLLQTTVQSNGHIVCSLEHFSLDRAPSYAALSYSWGAGDQSSVTLSISEQIDYVFKMRRQVCGSMTITQDLHNALRRLNHHLAGNEWLWIDAICVDQANTREKSDQVSRMRNIYRGATRVYVWLGEEAAADAAAEVDDGLNLPISKVDLLSLVTLEEKAWWSRLWVMQEIALAKDVVVCLGSRKSSWIYFIGYVTSTFQASSSRGRASANPAIRAQNEAQVRLHQLDRVRNSIRSSGNLSLWLLLKYSAAASATEARDKIIGLLELTSEDTRAHVPASYHIDLTAMFAKACMHIINESQSTDILVDRWSGRLVGSTHGPEGPYVSSWLPDFAGQVRQRSHPLHPGSFLVDEQEDGPGSAPYASGLSVAQVYLGDERISLPPIHFGLPTAEDILEHLAGTVLPFISEAIMTPSERRHFWRTLPAQFVDCDVDPVSRGPVNLPSVHTWESGLGKFVEDMLSWRMVVVGWNSSGQPVQPISKPHSHTESMFDVSPGLAHFHTDFDLSHGFVSERLWLQLGSHFKDLGLYWLSLVGKVLRHRVLFRTCESYVGIANPGIQEGDVAIVPWGASVPFLLRQIKDGMGESTRYKNRYTLVDGCIIQGVMNGELKDAYEAGMLRQEEYAIV
ncbi:hypothetical protein LTR22_017733 [Elasticomyces elasticus]|nr:hypothetical protein LTR22_017733 [Elasticomyces elasticus]KAK4913091.1 hypothetical protein LTR49_018557 [Elasticomyces elasticus]KAK5762515.1 hypothetical protein LTS12_007306 [Elasticomyces elasticus]